MSQPIRGQDGHLVFPIDPKKKTNLVRDIEILLSIKFRWIQFSGFWEVENVSANQRSGRQSCFFDRPEKRKFGREYWDLAFCQVSLNSVSWFQRRSRKCLSLSEVRAAILFFRSARKKKTNLVEDVEIWRSVKFRWILFSSFRGEVENVSADQRSGRPSCFSDRPEKHKHVWGRWDLAFCQVSLNSVERFQRRSRKCLSQSEVRTAIMFSARLEKHKLGRGCWDLASSKVSLNSV